MSQITPTTYEEFLALAAKGTVVPLVKTVMADLLTPVSAYLRVERQANQAFLLESVEGGEKIARYSFLGCAPHTIVRARPRRESESPGSEVVIERKDGTWETRQEALNTINFAKDLMNRAAGFDRLDVHLDAELTELARIADGRNFAEGMAAFFARRGPQFGVE